MAEQVFVIGAGPSGLAAAVAVAQQNPGVNVLVFEHHTRLRQDVQDPMPVLLHKQGKKALADMDIIVGTLQVEKCLRAEGEVVAAHEVFGDQPEVLTWKALIDGLLAKANSLPNLEMQKGKVVTSIDLNNRKLTVSADENSSTYSNSHSTYDLPKLLVLAEHCEDVMTQLTEQNPDFKTVSENSAGLALLAFEKVPVDGEGNIQVYTKGESGLVMVKELDVAMLATPARNAQDLTNTAVVKALLTDIGAPSSVIDSVLSRLATAKAFTTTSGSSSHVGITSKQGDAIVLVGPAAFRTDAPLCLDVNAGLYSAVLMASHVGAKGVENYNNAFAQEAIDLVKASRPNAVKAQVTLESALGLTRTHSRIREKCMGTTPLGNIVRRVAMAPLALVQAVILRPLGGIFNLIARRQ